MHLHLCLDKNLKDMKRRRRTGHRYEAIHFFTHLFENAPRQAGRQVRPPQLVQRGAEAQPPAVQPAGEQQADQAGNSVSLAIMLLYK